MKIPGESSILLDPQGRLREFKIIPPTTVESVALETPKPIETPWSTWFPAQSLGYDLNDLAPADWRGAPPYAADTRMAWQGVWPDSDEPLYVEAAAFRGRPVYFRVAHADDIHSIDDTSSPPTRKSNLGDNILVTVYFLLLLVGATLAWHNYRRRRIDRQGAGRLWITLALVHSATWCLLASHTLSPVEIQLFTLGIAQLLFTATQATLFYIALEPYVRRYWPQTLIT